jgi:hypothetical protein
MEKKVWFPKKKKIFGSLDNLNQELSSDLKAFTKDESLSNFEKVLQNILSPYQLKKPFIWKSRKVY